jgi:hypothetical protein
MNRHKRSAISVCLAIALSGLSTSGFAQPEVEALAVRRLEARHLVAEELKERAVRPVEERVVVSDAKRIVNALTEEQVEALLAGEGSPKPAVAAAVGDAGSDLLFVPLAPCRVIDTRFSTGGKMEPNAVRDFRIAGTTGFESQGGNPGGCGVPMGAAEPVAAAVMLNLVAVQAEGGGSLRAWQFNQPMPNASSINYQALTPAMNIANGLIVPIAGVSSLANDISVMGTQNRVHLVADVSGYFTRFPVESFQGGLKSSLQTHDFTTLINLGDGACHELNSCTVTTDVPGKVVVEAWGQFVMEHASGTLDRVAIGVETVDPVVCLDPDSVDASDYEVPASLGSNPDVDFTISHGVAFSQPGGTTRTYRLSGKVVSGASAFDKIENSRLICTFIPD